MKRKKNRRSSSMLIETTCKFSNVNWNFVRALHETLHGFWHLIVFIIYIKMLYMKLYNVYISLSLFFCSCRIVESTMLEYAFCMRSLNARCMPNLWFPANECRKVKQRADSSRATSPSVQTHLLTHARTRGWSNKLLLLVLRLVQLACDLNS